MESGTALADWASTPYQRQMVYLLASSFNITNTTGKIADVVDKLRSIPAKILTRRSTGLSYKNIGRPIVNIKTLDFTLSDVFITSKRVYFFFFCAKFNRDDENYLFLPSVEVLTDNEVFLPKSPMELMKTGVINDVPIITGVNLDEMLYLKYRKKSHYFLI